MLFKKLILPGIGLMLFSILFSACGSLPDQDAAVAAALTQTAAVLQTEASPLPPTETAAPKAVINGLVYLAAPPTPAMTIFAVNVDTGEWFSTKTEEAEYEAPYSIDVIPGTYEVFSQGLGYANAGEWGLAQVTVAEGQTLSGIDVAIPSPSDCGSVFGTPAAPDGSFAAVDGPDQTCVDFLLSGSAKAIEPDSATSELMRISFEPGSTMAQIPGHIAEAMGVHHYVLGAAKDQYMTVNLVSDEDVILIIWGADGTVLISDHAGATSWSGVLPASEDYYIDVRSTSPTNAYYSLEVYISAMESRTGKNGGVITGMLNYPESHTPPMHIVAYNQTTGAWFWLGSAENDIGYTMVDIPAGLYTLVAYTRNGYVGGYASAGDGELIPFQVNAGQVAAADFTMWLPADNHQYPASDDPVKW